MPLGYKPIVREKEKLISFMSALKTDMKSIVNQVFPEMLKNTNIFLKSSLNLLLQAPNKRVIRNLKEKKIAKLLSSDITKGAKPKVGASEILSLAKNSIGINNQSLEKVLISKRENSHLRRTIWHMARAATLGMIFSKLIMIKTK